MDVSREEREKQRIPFDITKLDIDAIVKYSEDVLGYELYPHQIEIIKNICEGKTVRTSRGIGRSVAVLCLAHYIATARNDVLLGRRIITQYEHNKYNLSPNVRMPYTVAVECGLQEQKYFDTIKSILPEDIFKREYLCEGD